MGHHASSECVRSLDELPIGDWGKASTSKAKGKKNRRTNIVRHQADATKPVAGSYISLKREMQHVEKMAEKVQKETVAVKGHPRGAGRCK